MFCSKKQNVVIIIATESVKLISSRFYSRQCQSKKVDLICIDIYTVISNEDDIVVVAVHACVCSKSSLFIYTEPKMQIISCVGFLTTGDAY